MVTMQPQGWSTGHVNTLPEILSNILQKEPDKNVVFLQSWGPLGNLGDSWSSKQCPADVSSLLRQILLVAYLLIIPFPFLLG